VVAKKADIKHLAGVSLEGKRGTKHTSEIEKSTSQIRGNLSHQKKKGENGRQHGAGPLFH